MDDHRRELIDLLNQSLALEHAARIQYLSHAERIQGLYSEKVIERIKEIASDEAEHENTFRSLIGSYLGGVPAMKMSDTQEAQDINGILNLNIEKEKAGIDLYKKVYAKIKEYREDFPLEFETMEHAVRHIIMDEQEHIVELKQLLGK